MSIETEALRLMMSELNEALVEAKRERDAAQRDAGSGAGKILTYSEPTGAGDFDVLCSMCHEPVAEPHTWVECLRKLAAHRDHLTGFAATLEHERDHARRQVKVLRRLLERSRASKADLRTLLAFARSERDKAEEELRALEWLTSRGHDPIWLDPGKCNVRGLSGLREIHSSWTAAACALGREKDPSR